MSNIAGNINKLKSQIPASVNLVAVSKTKPVSDIMEAYNAGQRAFGENRVQEMVDKKDELPNDIEWHYIGHLQSKKTKLIIPFVYLIHSVDSFKLLSTINVEALKNSRIVDCLLQIHIAKEETKFGFNREEVIEMIVSEEFSDLKNVRIRGLMGMATFTDDNDLIRNEFRYLFELYKDLKNRYFGDISHFNEISMGMSGDYEIAIKEGSTIVRIGSNIFGER